MKKILLFLVSVVAFAGQPSNALLIQRIEADEIRYDDAAAQYQGDESNLGVAYFAYFYGRVEQAANDSEAAQLNPNGPKLVDYYDLQKLTNLMFGLMYQRYFINTGDFQYFIPYVEYIGRSDQAEVDEAYSLLPAPSDK